MGKNVRLIQNTTEFSVRKYCREETRACISLPITCIRRCRSQIFFKTDILFFNYYILDIIYFIDISRHSSFADIKVSGGSFCYICRNNILYKATTVWILLTRKATGFKSLRLNYWEINQATLKCQIDFWTKLAKKVWNRKSEHHYKILHIQISLGTKFLLKLSLLNFSIKLTQKAIYKLKS